MSTPVAVSSSSSALSSVMKSDSNNITDDVKVNNHSVVDSLHEPLLPPGDVQHVSFDTDLEVATAAAAPEEDDDDNNVGSTTISAVVIDDSGWEHGTVQTQTVCRDGFWACLFLLQFGTVLTLAILGSRNMIRHGSDWLPTNKNDTDDSTHDDDDDNDDDGSDWNVIWFLLSMIGSVIVIASLLLNVLLGALAPMLIQISLVGLPILSCIMFVISLVTLNVVMALPSLIMFGFGIFYAWHVWNKVPFATANLNLALRAIKDNHGLWILAYCFTIKMYILTFLWCCAVVELVVFSPSWIYNCSSSDDDNNDTNADVCHLSTRGKFIALGMLLSLFWTLLVVKNIFHTTIAGVVGTWWFNPSEATSASASSSGGNAGCCYGWFKCRCCGCSRAIYNSLYRSAVYSFGSICFGSLLVGILQVIRFIVRCGRRQHNQQRRLRQRRTIEATDFLFCLVQYLVESLERLLEYINTWAYVYVGLYGYDYWTAGKEVANLFKARGWSVLINDHLIARSLSMMSIMIGLMTGLVGVILGLVFLSPMEALVPAFFLGVVLGGASCGILFGVVTSAVNTVVVCFAESPNSLRNNHGPELSDELIEAWRKAYPQECGF